MANIAPSAIAHHAAANNSAAGGATSDALKGAGGLDALFAALLAESGGDGAGGADAAAALKTAQPETPAQSKNAAKRMAELLNGSAKVAVEADVKVEPAQAADANVKPAVTKNSEQAAQKADLDEVAAGFIASRTGDAPSADATDTATAKDKPATDKTENKDAPAAIENEDAAAAILAALAAQPAQPAATPNTGDTEAPQEAGAQAIGATGDAAAKGHDNTSPDLAKSRALAQAAGAQSSGKIEDGSAKPGMADLPAESAPAAQTAVQSKDGKTQPAPSAAGEKGWHDALATLQPAQPKANAPAQDTTLAAAARKAAHQSIPAEKTTDTQSPQTAAAAAKAGGQGGNSASSNTGGQDAQSQDQHDDRDSAPAKPAATPAAVQTAAVTAPGNNNANTGMPDPNAMAQTAPLTQNAPAQLSATLQVAPQSAAHHALQSGPDDQAVPLSDLGAIAVSIAAKSQAGAKHFDINLHPSELGSINVRLTVDHSGTAQAHLSADTPQTLALLQRDSQALERALKDAGLNLAGSGLNFSLKGQDRQNGNGPGTNGRSRTLSVSAIASTNASPAAMASTYSLAPDSVRLDIRV